MALVSWRCLMQSLQTANVSSDVMDKRALSSYRGLSNLKLQIFIVLVSHNKYMHLIADLSAAICHSKFVFCTIINIKMIQYILMQYFGIFMTNFIKACRAYIPLEHQLQNENGGHLIQHSFLSWDGPQRCFKKSITIEDNSIKIYRV